MSCTPDNQFRKRPLRSRCALPWRSVNGGGYDKGKVLRGRHSSHGRANRTEVVRTGRHDSTKVFWAGARCSSCAASKILGTPRLHEPRAALARPGKAAASSRTARFALTRRSRQRRKSGGKPKINRVVM